MHYGYILRGTITGLWKVGVTGDVPKRFSQFKTHTPERVCLEVTKTFGTKEEAYWWERGIL
jgi:predicted GIY-YIG superfamily endonuclease